MEFKPFLRLFHGMHSFLEEYNCLSRIANALPIFIFHVIILETLNKGLLGFKISLLEITPVFEIPLVTVVALFLTLGLILLFKKVPILRTLIG